MSTISKTPKQLIQESSNETICEILHEIREYKEEMGCIKNDSLLALMWDAFKHYYGAGIGINRVIATITDEAAFRWYKEQKK